MGTGEEVSILDLAHLIAETVGFTGRIGFDKTKPDGTPRKLMDVSRLSALGWCSRVALPEGIRHAYRNYVARFGA